MAILNKIAKQDNIPFIIKHAHHFSIFNALLTKSIDQIKIISHSKKYI